MRSLTLRYEKIAAILVIFLLSFCVLNNMPEVNATTISCNNLIPNGDFETGNLNPWYSNDPRMVAESTTVYQGTYSAYVTGDLQDSEPIDQCGGFPSQFNFAAYLPANTISAVQLVFYPNLTGPGNQILYEIYNPATNTCSTFSFSICIPVSQSGKWYHISRNVQQDLSTLGYAPGPYLSEYIGLSLVGGTNLGDFVYYDSVSLSVTQTGDPPCIVPTLNNWVITSSCTLTNSASVSNDVIVNNGAVLTIPSGVTLTIPFTAHHLLIHSGGHVLIKTGGKISS